MKLNDKNIIAAFCRERPIVAAYRDVKNVFNGDTLLRVAEVQARQYDRTSRSATHQNKCEYGKIYLAQPSTTLATRDCGWYAGASTDTDIPNSYTILERALIAPNGDVYTVKWGGSLSKTINVGVDEVVSDEIPLSQSTYTTEFPAGEYIVKQIIDTGAVGNYIPTHTYALTTDVSGTQNGWYNAADTTLSTTYATGQYSVTGTALGFAGGYWNKPMIFGRPSGVDRSCIAFGDSNGTGLNDTTNKNIGGNGLVQRMAYNGGVQSYPMINISQSSARFAYFLNNTKWRKLLKYAKNAIVAVGGNNVADNDALATIQGYATTLWGICTDAGIERIIHAELITRTISTDSWATATLASQAASAAQWETGGLRDQYVDWLRTKIDDGTIHGISSTSSIRNTTYPYMWEVDGTANKYTSDGIHLSTFATEKNGKALKAAVDLALMGINPNGLLAWFTASDPSTITESAGAVSQWGEKYYGRNSATQSTAAAKPTYGATSFKSAYAGISADAGDYLDLASSIGYSDGYNIIVAAKPTDTAGNKYLFGGTAGAPIINNNSTEVMSFARQQQLNFVTGATVISTEAVQQAKTTGAGAGTGTQILLNGTSEGTGAAAPSFTQPITRLFGGESGGAIYNGYNGVVSDYFFYKAGYGDTAVNGLKTKYAIA